MKEGWEYKKLGDVGTFVRGGNFSKKDFVENGFPCIHYGQIHMKFGIETFKHISSVPAEMVKPDRCAHKGDLVIAVTSEDDAGSCKCTAWMGDYDAYVGGHTAIYRHTMQPKYVSYYFMSPFFQKDKLEYTHGFKVVEISPKDIAKISIPVPPLSEQQSIVDYLDSAFAKIDAMKANAEKALNEAKALFQAELSECMKPKEGWEEKPLGEVGTFIRGGNFSKKDFVEDGFPCIHYGQIHTKFGVSTYEHLSCVPKELVKSERCASKGDLVIAITSEDDEGSCKCTAWMANYDAYVGGHTAIFKHNLNPIFVSYYFKAARFQKEKLNYTHGFKVVEISPKDIAKISICYPSATEQHSIVATLDSLKSKVDRLQENYDKISKECDALKQALLRQVFE